MYLKLLLALFSLILFIISIQTSILMLVNPVVLNFYLKNEVAAHLAMAVYSQKSGLTSKTDQICQEYAICLTLDEINHLEDVSKIFYWIKILFIFSLLTAIFALYVNPYQSINFIHTASRNLALLVLILFILILFSWSYFFNQFHYLLFPQGNFSFNENSQLIKLFPDKFWRFEAVVFSTTLLLQYLIAFRVTKKVFND